MKINKILCFQNDTISIYNEILEKFVDLNYMFNLNNPLEVYALYTKLLYKGYFSYNYNFEYNEPVCKYKLFDTLPLGINVINGSGVCKHISSMLQDILNLMNIKNEVLTVYFYDSNEKIKYHFIGNHIINLTAFDNKAYFLDPTNCFIWKKCGEKQLLANKHREINTAYISSSLDNYLYNDIDINILRNIKEMLSMIQTSIEEDSKIINNVNKIYQSNLGIFEKFKKDNYYLYREINDKLIKIKKI